MASIPSIINGVCSIIRPVCNAVDVYVDIVDLVTEENVSELKIASVVSKSAVIALDILGIIGHHSGKFSNKTLSAIKGVECASRVVDAPLQFAKIVKNKDTKIFTAQGFIHLIEKGAIGPLAGILRNVCELNFYTEKQYLDEVKKNANAQRPTYTLDPHGESVLDGYKTIDPKECEKNIVLYEKFIAALNIKETTSKIGLLEGAYRVIIGRTLEKALNGQQILNQPIQQNVQVVQPAQQVLQPQLNPINIDNLFKFKQLSSIPVEFHNDKVFNRFICPITYCPIRHIVQDPTAIDAENPTFYEKKEIEIWVVNHGTSPITKKPLTVNQLIPRFDLQALIDGRLEFYEEEIRKYIDELAQK